MNMKKLLALVLVLALSLTTLAACTSAPSSSSSQGGTDSSASTGESSKDEGNNSANTNKVTLNTFSTYAGNDGNAENYQNAIKAWEEATGNTVNDSSATAEETVKAKIRTDFSTGAEPDVLFYFTGSDADDFLDKVVSIEDIRAEYPEYASNMNDDVMPKASNGVNYAVPVNGYWENMFVNKNVLAEAGVEIPGTDYTWEQFLADCQKIKDAGFTPIAASFVDVPHYWWEFAIFNNDTIDTHLNVPTSTTDEAGKAWVDGMQDIKDLYELGYFPEAVLSEKDEALQELFYTDRAAFMIDGSWRAGTIKTRASDADGNIDEERLDDFTVVVVPGKGERKATDMITGMSSGWYITKKAWDDADKRAAAVDFVTAMTTDEIVSQFAGTSATALKNGVTLDESTLDSLDKDVIALLANITGSSPAVQDIVAGDARNTMFQAIPQMVSGSVSPEELVQSFLDAFNQ